MIDIKPPIDCDVAMSSIEASLNLMKPHRPKGRVFFVCFTPEWRIFSRELERYIHHGYDAVFFQPRENLPSPYAWDLVMYSSETGEATARVSQRPEA